MYYYVIIKYVIRQRLTPKQGRRVKISKKSDLRIEEPHRIFLTRCPIMTYINSKIKNRLNNARIAFPLPEASRSPSDP